MKLRFCLKQAPVGKNEQMYIIGNKEGLGVWHIPNAVEMGAESITDLMMPDSGWTSKEITIKDEKDCKEIEYKYLISSKWEKGQNRVLNLAEFFQRATNEDNSYVLICDKAFDDRSHGWPKITIEKKK